MTQSSRADLWPLAIVALALVSLGGPLCSLSGYELATQYEDDAFYYFQIAKNVSLGNGFTFDGLHLTNGFHPLWLALLLPLFWLLPPWDAPVRAAGLLEALLLGCTGALVYCVMRKQVPRSAALGAGVMVYALPGTRSLSRVGLETALCMSLLAAMWWALTALDTAAEPSKPGPWCRWLLLGVLGALAALARLEAVLALGVVVWIARTQLRAAPSRALWLLGPAFLGLTLYFSWSYWHFETLLPVSGLVKHHWAAVQSGGMLGVRFVTLLQLMLVAVCALALWLRLRPALPWLSSMRFAWLTASGMLALDYVSLGHLERWYLGVALLAIAPVLASALATHRVLSLAALGSCVVLALARVPYTVHSVRHFDYQAELRGEAAQWLRQHLPPGTRVGAWNGGMLGYYSGQHVVMLDGLANSLDFFRRAIAGGDTLGYLRDEHIDYFATLGCGFDPVLWTPRSVDADHRLASSYQRWHPLSDRVLSQPCHQALQLWVAKPYTP